LADHDCDAGGPHTHRDGNQVNSSGCGQLPNLEQREVVIAGLDPAIHLPHEKKSRKEDGPREIGFTRFRTFEVRKSDKSDLRGQARERRFRELNQIGWKMR
jgi:hypothetical protein